MKRAHEAAAYDAWLRVQVQEEIDDPSSELTHEQAQADMARFFAGLEKEAGR